MISPRMASGRSLMQSGRDSSSCSSDPGGEHSPLLSALPGGRSTTGDAGGTSLIFLVLGAADSISIAVDLE